jgi:SAM-dependent methyltransferase
MKTLDVGCGHDKLPGAVGIDRSADTLADVVHDLDTFPWPFEDDSFDLIRCQDVLEHLDDFVRAMEELHRIARPGAEIRIRVPHFSSVQAYTDPTHRHFFSTESMQYFVEGSPYPHYTKVRFRQDAVRLTMWRPFRLVGLEVIVNRWPLRYEKMFAFTFPSQFLEFVMRVPADGA